MKRAFTLIELLVTIVLFSLLLIIALYSFSFMSLNIKSINNTNPKDAIYYHELRNAISSIYPYVDVDINEQNRYKSVHYFFNGKEKECYFITSSAFFFKKLVLSHIYFKEKSLWYEEGIIFDKNIDYKKLYSIPMTHRVKIIDNINRISFSYIYLSEVLKELNDKLPSLITINIFKGKEKKNYSFAIKSDNTLRLGLIQEKRAGF